ncbi:hypothetical protein FLAG1_08052 [Fusarium langsethiae]|uniref:DUF6536 domain-containing protein n=1 Tax=Fusarium langsethiae TaxID=179993 RepID=A0A0N0DD34_FUSLA|nr:hypothetical protein FLAG1_08052 [Fusarium langsethiae]
MGAFLVFWGAQKPRDLGAHFIFFEGSCVLASSNFFMQLLSSPTRSEIDKAHKANRALKIGVQSLRNVFLTSKIKFICWMTFFVSSFPLHLFFNSAVFSTQYLGSDWHLTIASSGFVDGANFWGSGAALWPPQHGETLKGYGSPGNLDEYFNSSSSAFKKIQNTSQTAKHWKGVDRMPLEKSNSLWFAADCKTSLSPEQNREDRCSQTCSKAVGLGQTQSESMRPGAVPSTYTLDFFRNTITDESWPGLSNETATNLTLKYCFAEEISQNCKVGVSNQLLLIVVISIAGKGLLCVVVLFVLPKEQPLAVVGDAIESFIQCPDSNTVDRCLLDRDMEEDMGVGYQLAITGAPVRQSWTSAIERKTWARSYGLMSMNILLLAGGFLAAQRNAPITGQSLLQSMNNGILSVSPASPGRIIDFVLRANLPQLLLLITYFIYNNIYTYLCTEMEWNSYGGSFQPLRVSQPKGQQRSTYRLQLPYRYSIPLIIVSIFMHWLVSNAIYVFVVEGDYYELHQLVDVSSLDAGVPGIGLSKDAYVGVGYSTLTILVLFITSVILPGIPTLLGQRKVKTSMPLVGASSVVMSAACHVPILEDNTGFRVRKKTLRKEQLVVAEDIEENVCPTTNGSELNENQELLGSTNSSFSVLDDGSCADLANLESDPTPHEEDYLREVTRNPVRWGVVRTPASWKEKHAKTGSSSDTVQHLSFGTELHDVTGPIPGQWNM